MSRWDRVIELASVRYEQDEEGRQRAVETRRRVFCNELTIGSQAFWEAAQAGHAPEARVEVRACEYLGERVCYYGGRRLLVSRVQSAGADYARLDLEGEVGEACP